MMQSCPSCQQPNRPEAKFCAACGAALGQSAPEVLPETVPPVPPTPEATPLPPGRVLCPHCGKTVAARAKFCNYCGQALTSAAPAVSAAATAPDVEPSMTVPALSAAPSAAANEQAAAPVDASSAPVVQPSEQSQSLPAMQGTPPPYSPPSYTPKPQKISRSQKIIMLATGGVVALILIALIIVAFGGGSLESSAPTMMPTIASTPLPDLSTSTPSEVRQPTATLAPPAATQSSEETMVVLPDDTLLGLVERHCAGRTSWVSETSLNYAHRVADLNDIPWNNGSPNIVAGNVLKLLPCPE